LLLRQQWRTSINHFAEAMTLFAVALPASFRWRTSVVRGWRTGSFRIEHDGHLAQLPNPLMWDVFAVSTYASVSFMFWFVGLIPDLATLRDRSPSRVSRAVYSALAMGWRGSALRWHRTRPRPLTRRSLDPARGLGARS
jgi:molybdopterin-containing oxidoreductase family membrane subunit